MLNPPVQLELEIPPHWELPMIPFQHTEECGEPYRQWPLGGPCNPTVSPCEAWVISGRSEGMHRQEDESQAPTFHRRPQAESERKLVERARMYEALCEQSSESNFHSCSVFNASKVTLLPVFALRVCVAQPQPRSNRHTEVSQRAEERQRKPGR